ncbi:hypothetical protein XELAEV_18014610mg [Xenopus laevis]|uniref:Uncharacterized protein n=1 Tax=Xenopus laevis TaxID=8355 RepID=A0A974DIS5_XENLA|nr:hypothetical protein XELAEV_18014610mg [Xenopus laevis]
MVKVFMGCLESWGGGKMQKTTNGKCLSLYHLSIYVSSRFLPTAVQYIISHMTFRVQVWLAEHQELSPNPTKSAFSSKELLLPSQTWCRELSKKKITEHRTANINTCQKPPDLLQQFSSLRIRSRTLTSDYILERL